MRIIFVILILLLFKIPSFAGGFSGDGFGSPGFFQVVISITNSALLLVNGADNLKLVNGTDNLCLAGSLSC